MEYLGKMDTHRKPNSFKQRVRNSLSINDKVRVINAYTLQPCYQKLGNVFKCSGKQVKYIIVNKNKILAQHAKLQSQLRSGLTTDDVYNQDFVKLDLLDKVMNEWYQRARLHSPTGVISYKMIREKVFDARKALNIGTFIPKSAWLVNFRNNCNKKPGYRNFPEKKSLPLDMRVVAKFVLEQQGVSKQQMRLIYGIDAYEEARSSLVSENNNLSQVTDKLDIPDSVKVKSSVSESSEDYLTDFSSDCNSIEDDELIRSNKDAVKYLKPLEDYALLQENYRAIGLISQLESIFLKATEDLGAQVRDNLL